MKSLLRQRLFAGLLVGCCAALVGCGRIPKPTPGAPATTTPKAATAKPDTTE